jgi:hypothetical protein
LCDYDHDGRVDLAVAQNGSATKLFRNTGGKVGLRILLKGPTGNPQGIGACIRLHYRDGRLSPVREVHAGGGYWSQDAATQVMGLAGDVETVIVKWPGGATTRHPVPQGAKEIRVGKGG